MRQNQKEKSFSKIKFRIYILAFVVLVVAMIFLSYGIAEDAFYFDINNHDVNAATLVY